ncbi:MAG: glycosyltransferase [Anaerolineae bacterium]
MKILFISPYVPNLIRVRPYNLIRSLTALGHEVTVLTLWVKESEQQDLRLLENICSRVLSLQMPTWKSIASCMGALVSGDPFQSYYSWEPKLLDLVEDVNYFDVIHVEHLRGVRYALHYLNLKECSVPVVWDSVDCISHLFRQAVDQSKSFFGSLATKLDLARTERFEGWLINTLDTILVTSEIDKTALVKLSNSYANASKVIVLPNGVNLEYFKPNPEINRESSTLVVTGKMSYHANVTMVLNLVNKIMPKVWESRPDVKLYVVGKDPSPEITEAGKNPQIIVTGTVDDMRPYLQKATVAVAPVVYGAGIQNKVLEAMACGIPVITTPQSAGSISAVPGKEFCIADGPEEFAEKTVQLINNPSMADQIGHAGYSFLRKNHDWMSISDRLEEVYDGVICD